MQGMLHRVHAVNVLPTQCRVIFLLKPLTTAEIPLTTALKILFRSYFEPKYSFGINFVSLWEKSYFG